MQQSRLDKTTSVAFIVVCALLAVYTGARLFDRWQAQKINPRLNSYKTGDKLERVPGFDAAGSHYTLLVVVRNGCPYCEASMEFYDAITKRRAPGILRFIALAGHPQIQAAQYIAQTGVKFDGFVSIAPTTLRIQSVPQLLLVDGNGMVQRSWRGQLTSAQQDDVFKTLRQLNALVQ